MRFYAASPGNLKTAFNGFRGTKDPLDGAKVVVELTLGDEKYDNGFWQLEGTGRKRLQFRGSTPQGAKRRTIAVLYDSGL